MDEERTFVSREDTEEWMKKLQEGENVEPQVEEFLDVEEEPLSSELLGLLYVGKLSRSFIFQGHDITIRTLKVGEELQASLLTKDFEDSGDAVRALATAIVAACVDTVDGKPLVSALGPSEDDLIQKKFDYVREKWYWPTVRAVYDEYIELLKQQEQVLKEFQKK